MAIASNDRLRDLRSRAESRAEFAQKLRWLAARDLTLPEMRLATQLLRDFPEPTTPLRIAVLGSYTTELFRDYWVFHALLHGFDLDLRLAPYGQIVQGLRQASDLFQPPRDFTFLLLAWPDIVPALAEPVHALSESDREKLVSLCESGARELLAAAERPGAGTVVVSVLPSPKLPGLGLYDGMAEASEAAFRTQLKERVSALLRREFPSAHWDDGEHLLWTLGTEGLFDSRLWHTSRFPFSVRGAQLFIQRLMRFPVLFKTPRAKCVVLDADGTLWGGIIGEDGLSGIHLGPDYPGCCYVEFQRRLLDLVHRGFLLALCSKNNPEDVQKVLREHPQMVLRESHFAAIRANWEPKPANLEAIAEELRLGLDALVFVDDSPQECRMVHQMLPGVRAVQVPERPVDIPTCLDHLQELEIVSFTAEDRLRAAAYAQERERRALALRARDVSEYLASLGMQMRVWLNGTDHRARLAQLTQKTNQFNLTTRRYTEKDIESFQRDTDRMVAYFSLADVFGDNGIVGLTVLTGMTTDTPTVDTFLLSCRVIGRQAEEVFLHAVLKTLKQMGKSRVVARYLPTAKNGLVRDFWERQGFAAVGDGLYERSLSELPGEHPAASYFRVELSGAVQ